MNKRFFTLMAAVLLAGAPLCNEAFAELYVPVSVASTSTKLANGLKFVIKTGTTTASDGSIVPAYATVTAGATAGTVVLSASAAYDKDATAVFEVRNYSSATKTFELYVDSKKVVKVISATQSSSLFYASTGSTTVDDLTFNGINVAEFGVSSATSLVSGNPMFVANYMDDADLNSNLSNNGFKFSFPGVVVQPEVNLFANQMVAIPAATVNTVWTAAPASGMYFVLADAAGLKLKSAVNADNLKAATFIVVNPNKNFGITGLSAANGEGFDFTTVKGEKLKSANKPSDGEIAYQNGVFFVQESDCLNASDELDIRVNPHVVKDANTLTVNVGWQYVGVYSLTTGGLKSYVTTKNYTTSLAKASTGGNTYVAAADVLKASKEAAIYNIFFQGNDGSIGKSDSYYGKYLTLKASGDTAAYAPGYVDTNLTQAQWVVSNVEAKGVVTFTNVYNGKEAKFKLYKTANAGVYQASFADAFPAGNEIPKGAGEIKLIPATEGSSFLTVTDAQLGREIDFAFVGSGPVTVNKIYPTIDPVYVGSTFSHFNVAATSNAKDAESWKFEKATEIEHVLDFIYLDGSTPKSGESKCKVQTYYLKSTSADKYAVSLSNSSRLAAIVPGVPASTAATTWGQYAFRKNANGTYTILNYVAPSAPTTTTPYEALVANTANVWSANTGAALIQDMAYNVSAYNTVVVDFEQLGKSLPAVSRHATFEGVDGGISMIDAKGMTCAIVTSNPLTFWLDTAETKAETPKFYISKGIATNDEEEVETKAAEAETRLFLHYAVDSLSYWDPNKAQFVNNDAYLNNLNEVMAIFRPAALVGVDTLATVQNGKEILVSKAAKAGVCQGGLGRFQFAITEVDDEEYVITNNDGLYLYNLNGVLAFTKDDSKAMVVTVGEGDPTANEAIEAESNVQVIGGQGVVTVQGAAGKVITVANILGQTIANQVAASDNVTIAAPAGIAVVSVDGEATKVVVK